MNTPANNYHPFTPPFRYEPLGPCIFDDKGHKVFDVRGWGFLTGKASLDLSGIEAEKIQNKIAKRVVELMNADATNRLIGLGAYLLRTTIGGSE